MSVRYCPGERRVELGDSRLQRLGARARRGALLEVQDRLQKLDGGAKRRRFAMRQALGLANHHARRLRPPTELVGEPRLPYPCFADQRYRLPASLPRACQAILEEDELALPPDQGRQATLEKRIEAALPPALPGHRVDAHGMIDALERRSRRGLP